MVARLVETQAPRRLTQENHPENAAEEEKLPTVSLSAMVAISALTGVIGMTLGAAALSTLLEIAGPAEVASMLPLVVALVCFLTGWVGAFFWMCREESMKKESPQE